MLICFTLPVAGSYLWLRYERKMVRREVKATLLKGLDKKELVLLAFTEAEDKVLLQWEHSGEFTFSHQKYDIVSRKKVGKKMRYWCWKDTKESAIDQKITELTRRAWGNNPQKDKQHKIATETVKSIHHFASPELVFELDFDLFEKPIFYYSEKLTVKTVVSSVPPPEAFC